MLEVHNHQLTCKHCEVRIVCGTQMHHAFVRQVWCLICNLCYMSLKEQSDWHKRKRPTDLSQLWCLSSKTPFTEGRPLPCRVSDYALMHSLKVGLSLLFCLTYQLLSSILKFLSVDSRGYTRTRMRLSPCHMTVLRDSIT